ncbi:MAG TPA: hypothetical protein VNK95_15055, partial [Caldilineaceae bacterium]|nr:hypothetical protein [Caldilineaceae bacterium]
SHTGSFRITGTRADGSRVILPLDVQVNITPPAAARLPLYLPIVSTGAFSAWEYPGPAGRTVHRLSGSASVGITLPFTLTLKGQTLTTGRLFADGFVTLPATTGVSSLPNQCLPNLVRPAVGLYGWWADLDPGTGQGTISTFQTTTGRFVVEYADIPAAPAANSPYRVSFQIVLQANGRVELNYGRVPPVGDGPPPVTIGVRAADGRFYNQVACITSTTELGALPRTHERLIFNPEDFY